MIEIPVGHGLVAVVDDEDAEFAGLKWRVTRSGSGKILYAVRSFRSQGRKGTVVLHRLIMRAPPGAFVDHRDGNGLNCRRANLRFATRAENERNQGLRRDNTSGYKGVSRENGRWVAYINVRGRQLRLGLFDVLEDAARAYDAAAVEHFGAFARLNSPRGAA